MECKAILDLKPINDAKGYRVWNNKLKNAFDQARPRSREVINWLESVREKKVIEAKGEDLDETMASSIITIAQLDGDTEAVIQERCSLLKDLSRDLWAVLQAKAEGEALQKASAVEGR